MSDMDKGIQLIVDESVYLSIINTLQQPQYINNPVVMVTSSVLFENFTVVIRYKLAIILINFQGTVFWGGQGSKCFIQRAIVSQYLSFVIVFRLVNSCLNSGPFL